MVKEELVMSEQTKSLIHRRVAVPEAVVIRFVLLGMVGVLLGACWGS